jgi:hypothetical protein
MKAKQRSTKPNSGLMALANHPGRRTVLRRHDFLTFRSISVQYLH